MLGNKKATFFKGICDFFNKPLASFTGSLAPAELKEIEQAESPTIGLKTLFIPPLERINFVHYSWFKESLEVFPGPFQLLILNALPSSQSNPLGKLLNVSLEQSPYAFSQSIETKQFICQFIYARIAREVLPLEFLPTSELSKLLINLSKAQMVVLLDLLGLFPLAQELKKVVDKKVWEKALSFLPGDYGQFLKSLIQYNDKIGVTALGMENWLKSPSPFRRLLQQQGLFRLSIALKEESDDVLWYVSHKLDIGRGKKLQNLIQEDKLSKEDKYDKAKILWLRQEIVNLIKEVYPS